MRPELLGIDWQGSWQGMARQREIELSQHAARLCCIERIALFAVRDIDANLACQFQSHRPVENAVAVGRGACGRQPDRTGMLTSTLRRCCSPPSPVFA
jgi:hypothetical protein